MSYALTRLTGDGSTTTYTIGFAYRDAADVIVKVDGVTKTVTTHYTFPTGGTQVTFGSAPADGAAILIQRATSQSTRLVDYAAGAVFKESDLDTDSTQGFYMAQEAIDIANDSITKNDSNLYDAEGVRVINVADPVAAQDAATKAFVQTVVGDFNSRYYGALATAPTSPTPSEGDLWYDSANDVMKVYANSGWQQATSAVATSSNRAVYTVGTVSGSYTGSSSTFPAVYDSGFVDVFLNGAKLIVGTDFQATNGSFVYLTPAASSGDKVDIVAYGAAALANINTVADDIANINTVATNISAVQGAAGNASTATTKAAEASASATAASNSASTASGWASTAGTKATEAAASATSASGASSSAATQASNASTSATNAATSATAASTSATSAATSASTATTKATEASNSATAAASSATTANTAATNATNTVNQVSADVATVAGISSEVTTVANSTYKAQVEAVADDLNGSNTIGTALTSANNAAASASTASTKASEAATSASTATSQASTATAQASSASGHASTAASEKAAAVTAKNAAETAASNASSSESNAANSASAAASSYSAANSSASAAASSATNAAASATEIKSITAATGAAGSSASYDSGSGVLSVPRGDTGATGPTGPQGPQGDQGAAGPAGASATAAGSLVYGGATKLQANSTGIDVTGTATMDGLTVDGGAGNSLVNLTPSGTYSTVVSFANAASAFDIVSYGSGSASADNFRIRDNGASRFNIAGNGDISFYEDTGTTPKLFWDASAESLGIGTSAPSEKLELTGWLKVGSGANEVGGVIFPYSTASSNSRSYAWRNDVSAYGDFSLLVSDTQTGSVKGGTKVISVRNNNVGIGVSSPSAPLTVNNNTDHSDVAIFHAGGGTPNRGLKISTFSNTNSNAGVELDAQTATGAFKFSTGGNERIRIDSSGKVGIGTSSPSDKLELFTTDTDSGINLVANNGSNQLSHSPKLKFNGEYQSNGPFIQGLNTGAVGYKALVFNTVRTGNDYTTLPAEAMRIDSSGNVGIGTASPSNKLEVYGGDLRVTDNYPAISLKDSDLISTYGEIGGGSGNLTLDSDLANNAANSYMKFGVDGSERMRIDSSGNLLVGTTQGIASSSSVSGVNLLGSGYIAAARNGAVAYLNRQTSDGDIAVFRKDGTTVGSIGVISSDNLFITGGVANHSGLALSQHSVLPMNGPSYSTGTVDLGSSGVRWKDLHLSGQAYASYLRPTAGSTDFINFSSGAIRLATGGSESARIDTSGSLLVGTTSTPNGTSSYGAGFIPAADARTQLHMATNSTSNLFHVRFYNPNGAVGDIRTNGSSTTYNTSSDQRLKENIADADDAGSKIDAIQVRKYDWKVDGSHQDYGMIAQELQTVAPEAVSGDADSEEMMGVDYSKLVPMLIKEIQSLRNRVAQLEE